MNTRTFASRATWIAGLVYLATTITMFVAPRFFFEYVGHFPPFNRHYTGDSASFLIAIAVGLLYAARDPVRHRAIIAIGAGASVIHTLNHFYDAIFEGVTNAHHLGFSGGVAWALDLVPLLLLAAALASAYYRAEPVAQTS